MQGTDKGTQESWMTQIKCILDRVCHGSWGPMGFPALGGLSWCRQKLWEKVAATYQPRITSAVHTLTHPGPALSGTGPMWGT